MRIDAALRLQNEKEKVQKWVINALRNELKGIYRDGNWSEIAFPLLVRIKNSIKCTIPRPRHVSSSDWEWSGTGGWGFDRTAGIGRWVWGSADGWRGINASSSAHSPSVTPTGRHVTRRVEEDSWLWVFAHFDEFWPFLFFGFHIRWWRGPEILEEGFLHISALNFSYYEINP